jgi:hypothetical protein
VRPATRILGVGVAILAWLGWFAAAPRLGFPTVAPAAMFNRVLVPNSEARSWIGWAVLVAGLAALAGLFGFAARRGLFRAGAASGIVYGMIAWVVVGAVVMPLFGMISMPMAPAPVPSDMGPPTPTPDPVRGTFMMLSLGPLAPVSALIAWVLFGVVLGVTFGLGPARQPGRAGSGEDTARRAPGLRIGRLRTGT